MSKLPFAASTSDKLLFTAVTSGGRAYDIEFSLHPQTRSPEAVSELLADLLAELSRKLERHGNVSDGDVLQAVSMMLAIRARMVDAEPETVANLIRDLLDHSFQAVKEAYGYQAARA